MKKLERLLEDIKLNTTVSRFNEALVGMSLWVLIGMYDIPIYATTLKVTQMLGKVVSGYIECEMADKPISKLCNISLRTEIIKTMIYSVGHIIIAFNFTLGISLIIFGNLFSGVHEAILIVFRDRITERMYFDPEDRSKFRGLMKIAGSKAHTIGLCLNLAVMTYSQSKGFDQILTIKVLLAFYGFTGAVDLLVSFKERKSLKDFLNI